MNQNLLRILINITYLILLVVCIILVIQKLRKLMALLIPNNLEDREVITALEERAKYKAILRMTKDSSYDSLYTKSKTEFNEVFTILKEFILKELSQDGIELYKGIYEHYDYYDFCRQIEKVINSQIKIVDTEIRSIYVKIASKRKEIIKKEISSMMVYVILFAMLVWNYTYNIVLFIK